MPFRANMGYGKDPDGILTQWRLRGCWAGGSNASGRLEQQSWDMPTAAHVAASTSSLRTLFYRLVHIPVRPEKSAKTLGCEEPESAGL